MGYKVQIDDLVRDATDDEIAAIKTGEEAQAAREQAAATAEAARSSARAKLKALGLTGDEIAALIP